MLMVLVKELVVYGGVENVWFGLTRKTTVVTGESEAALRDAEYGCDGRGASKNDHLV